MAFLPPLLQLTLPRHLLRLNSPLLPHARRHHSARRDTCARATMVRTTVGQERVAYGQELASTWSPRDYRVRARVVVIQ
jgi:hypothetical protein